MQLLKNIYNYNTFCLWFVWQIHGIGAFQFKMSDVTNVFGYDIGGKQMFIKAWVYDYFWMDTMNGTAVTDVFTPGVRFAHKNHSFFKLLIHQQQNDSIAINKGLV